MSKIEHVSEAIGRHDKDCDTCDVLIIGAGPVGLSMSLSLRGAGLDVRLFERQTLKSIEDPQFDGREIALSHRSVEILQKLGAWARIPEADISPLKSANVMNGQSQACLHFNAKAVGADKLGFFVSNNLIRRALYEEHEQKNQAALIADAEATSIHTSSSGAVVTLADGRALRGKLLIAADTRFSASRRCAGISASIHDFGKTMIVSRMKLERLHDHIAWECFLPGGAVAVLPLNDGEASIVQTFAPEEAARHMALNLDDYAGASAKRLKHRFGAFHPVSERFSYPLVGVYSNRFVGPAFALIGDAAVGMHPVTAHGFNLGVQGQDILARKIQLAVSQGKNFAGNSILVAYERAHRKLSGPLYWSTLALAELYSHNSLPARFARRAMFDAGRVLSPARHVIMKSLTQPLGSTAY